MTLVPQRLCSTCADVAWRIAQRGFSQSRWTRSPKFETKRLPPNSRAPQDLGPRIIAMNGQPDSCLLPSGRRLPEGRCEIYVPVPMPARFAVTSYGL